MTEEIDKLVVKLGFELDSDSESQIAKYKNRINELERLEDKVSKTKIKTPFVNFQSSTRPLQEVVKKYKETIPKFLPLSEYRKREALQSRNTNWNEKWDSLSLAKQRSINSFLDERGFGDILQSRGEKYRTYLDVKRELLNSSKLTIQKEEKFRTKIFTKSQGERDRIVRKFLSTWSVGARGYLTGIFARLGTNVIKQRGKAAQETAAQALMSNMSTQGVQSMQGLATGMGIEPEELFQAINVYRQKTRAWRVPDDVLLQRLMQQAKAPNAHALAAQMNGIPPHVFMKLKEYKGNLKNDLENQKWKLSDNDLKNLERFKTAVYEAGRALLWFMSKVLSGIVEIVDKISPHIDKFKESIQAFKNPIKTIQDSVQESFEKVRQAADNAVSSAIKDAKSSIQENVVNPAKKWLEERAIQNIREENPDFENLFQSPREAADRSNVVVNNSFNISSNDPRGVSEEIQKILNSQYINLFSTPRTVA